MAVIFALDKLTSPISELQRNEQSMRVTMRRSLILARHGQSEFNLLNKFTGWADPTLTESGRAEARRMADALMERGISVDAVFCSALDRARQTAEIIASCVDLKSGIIELPALNARNYGQLTGHNKADAAARWGESQIVSWRRSYAAAPPDGESLRDVIARVLPCFVQDILPVVMNGRPSLVVSHGNILRALIMVFDRLLPSDVETLEFLTGEIRHYELASDATIRTCTILPKQIAPAIG